MIACFFKVCIVSKTEKIQRLKNKDFFTRTLGSLADKLEHKYSSTKERLIEYSLKFSALLRQKFVSNR
jgi:hypothetical protein